MDISKLKNLNWRFWSGLLLVLMALSNLVYWSQFHIIRLEIGLYTDSSWDVPTDEGTKMIDQAIREFEKKHPKVDVVYESGIDKAGYSSWLSDKIILGETPDVFMLPDGSFNSLAQDKVLLNLNPYMNRLDTNDFYPASLKAGQYQGTSYSLPYENNVMMLCINKDLLEAADIEIPSSGWSLDEFYQLCKKLSRDTDGDGQLDQFGVTDYSWQDAISAHGLSIFSNEPSGSVSINNEGIKSALDFYTKLDKLSGATKVSSDDFDKGKVAFMPMTLAEYRTYKPYPYHISKYSSFEWTCVQMPVKSKKVVPNQLQTSLFGISSKSQYKDLAWEFMTLLTKDDYQTKLMIESSGASVKKSVVQNDTIAKQFSRDNFGSSALTTDTLDGMLSRSRVQPSNSQSQEIMDKADYLITQSITKGTLDGDLQDIQEKLNNQKN
ncbi:ABC transporter substrate-binding protein [Streptococcus dentapri]|uniref:ABC transporter substrate-binding protein n=1 Tax=Streptococcus dentapri TaxID=573564 RepID=A0ABV8D090_9STRE